MLFSVIFLKKIHLGIESEVVDLAALVEQFVSSSIYWLFKKVYKGTIPETQSPSNCQEACGSSSIVASELIQLLVREPKELTAKHKCRNPMSEASDPGATPLTSDDVVREYELQILFGMEILESEVGNGVKESMNQKFIRQICLLLENIQRHLEEGFFGEWNLENYAAKIIKIRYSHNLGDVVHKIYNKMDLKPFDDEDEAPNRLNSSEDSKKSWKEKIDRCEVGENDMGNGHFSAENEPFHLLKKDSGGLNQRTEQEDHEKRLIEAKERRERARRLSSFTSWIPDLRRVWAPKQKGVKHKSESNPKLQKRKDQQRASHDTLFETPMTGNKRSCQWINDTQDDSYQDHESNMWLCF